MEKWTFKNIEIDMQTDEVRVEYSEELNDMFDTLLKDAFGISYMKAEKNINRKGLMEIRFKAPIEDIENFEDALVGWYISKYGIPNEN